MLRGISIALLVAGGCIGPPDAAEVNAPGPWRLHFTLLIDNPDFSISHEPAVNYPDRIAHLPAATDACDAGCTCAYTPAHLVDEDIDEADHVYADFAETFDAANRQLRCLGDINFSDASTGYGVCLEQAVGAKLEDPSGPRARYDLTLARM
jgi:hypothetical protein